MQAPPQPQQSRPLTAYPPPSVMAQVQQIQQPPPQQQPQIQQQPQQTASFPAAPEKPAKPFDLFFKHQVKTLIFTLVTL